MGTSMDCRALKAKADKLINLYNIDVEKMKVDVSPDYLRLFKIKKILVRLDKELQESETKAKTHQTRTNLRKTQDSCQSLLSAVDEVISSQRMNGLVNMPSFPASKKKEKIFKQVQ